MVEGVSVTVGMPLANVHHGRGAMNIFIQRGETREFLAAPDDWVQDPHDAQPFADTRAALTYCRKHDLREVRLVLVFGDHRVSVLRCVSGSETPVPADALKAAA